jgi:pimeloyl-ACP methyl ester carboxylesterase
MEEDLDCVVRHIRSVRSGSLGLLGYSAGTSVALSYANRVGLAVFSIALWGTCFRRFYSEYYADLDRARSDLSAMQTSMAPDFEIAEDMLPEYLVPRLNQPIFFGYGSHDTYATLSDQCGLFESSQNTANVLYVLKNGRHAMDKRHPGFTAYARAISEWFDATLV